MQEEKEIRCPSNLTWLRAMASVLPEGLRGKIAPYAEKCLKPETERFEVKVEGEKPEG